MAIKGPALRRLFGIREKKGAFEKKGDSAQQKLQMSGFQGAHFCLSNYNNIVILDTPDSRVLLLDSSTSFTREREWTDAYWDEFATLPAIVPKGPLAIFGLLLPTNFQGGATAAHLMLELWPSLLLVGWEIDEIVSVLEIHIGDVLSPSVTIPGGYAGIIVDLFSDGKVLPQLQEVTTWLEMNKMDDPRELSATNNALCKAFPEQVSWKKLRRAGENYLALTGPLPDLTIWSACLRIN
ncbi:hypothetical protein HAX54_048680 [Datura stramonium]|uniref:Uncharacterized protein n=1 Tax=Datura stramonium TaxID=4076 RepID=A0ABS8SUC6_DATST|nr:hypothetical protein [Datura stramonium]